MMSLVGRTALHFLIFFVLTPTRSQDIYLDGRLISPVSVIRERLGRNFGPPPWNHVVIAREFYDFIAEAKLRGAISTLDAMVDQLVDAFRENCVGGGLELARSSRKARDKYVLSRESPSQLGVDGYALSRRPVVPGITERYFVDAGCHHPFRLSNTWLLERAGWVGVAIDANNLADLFEKRKRTRFVQALLWSEGGAELQFAARPGVADGDTTSVEASPFDGLVDTLGTYRRQVLDGEPGGLGGARVRAQTTSTLASVLDRVGAPPLVDFLSLDVEGAELEVLRTFPFNRYRFGLICLEHNYEEPKRSLLRDLLVGQGYIYAGAVLFDDIYEWPIDSGEMVSAAGTEAAFSSMGPCSDVSDRSVPCWGYRDGNAVDGAAVFSGWSGV